MALVAFLNREILCLTGNVLFLYGWDRPTQLENQMGLVPEQVKPTIPVAMCPHGNHSGCRSEDIHIPTGIVEGHAPLFCAGRQDLSQFNSS